MHKYSILKDKNQLKHIFYGRDLKNIFFHTISNIPAIITERKINAKEENR